MATDQNVISIAEGRRSEAGGLTERTDDELMLLARGGRQEAFEVLVRRHQLKALKVACRQLGDQSLARDVAQSTFVEIYRYLPKYQAQGRFTSLLFRILRNQCLMIVRKQGYADSARDELQHMPPADPSLPDESILASERRREVERGLGKLSDKLREVLVLRFSGELSYKEISEQLDVPVGTVKSRIAAGMEKMREVLEGGI